MLNSLNTPLWGVNSPGWGGAAGVSEDCPDFCFAGLVVGGNYVWCLFIVVMFMGFGGAKKWEALSSHNLGWHCNPQNEGRSFFMRKGGSLLYWNFIVTLTGYCKRFYRINSHIEINKVKKAILNVLNFIRLILNYSACTIISLFITMIQTPLVTVSQEYTFLQLKIWIKIFLK